MWPRGVGYVGQNLTLGRTTGRTLRLAGLGDRERLAGVIGANLSALAEILAWNASHGIRLFRIASGVIPFASHPAFDLDWRGRFAAELAAIRSVVTAHGLRLSMHPGQYTVLNAHREDVVAAALAELAYHADVLEALAPGEGTIVLHVGGRYGDATAALARFAEGVARLEGRARALLALEHDDRLFDVDDVLPAAEALGLPVVFDVHHHRCLHRRADWDDGLGESLERVVASWGVRVPKVHVSSPRAPGETAHADHVAPEDLERLLDLMAGVGGERPFDLMVEAKAKERAALPHLAAVAARNPRPAPWR